MQRPLSSTLFPYTTLFRSRVDGGCTEGGWLEPPLRHRGRAAEDQAQRRRLQRAGGHGDGVPARHEQVGAARSEEHTSELQSRLHLVCRLLLEKKKKNQHDQ